MVSIITPFLNAERFLMEAIESVLAQTYGDWELLLVDDGSTDSSARIAFDYAGRHSDRIRYFHHEGGVNRGTSASRNLGVSRSRGEYIALLDADDTWSPEKLERQVAILDAHPEVGMVQGPMMYWYSWSGLPEDISRDHIKMDGIDFALDRVVEPPAMFPRWFRIDGPGTVTLLFRTSAFDRIGGFEERFTDVHDDATFLLKMYLAEKVFVSSECFSRYRQHRDSCCHQENHRRNWPQEYLYFLAWVREYLAIHGIKDPTLWREVDQHAWPVLHPHLARMRPAHLAQAVKRRFGRLLGT